jgi:hypothetical protein
MGVMIGEAFCNGPYKLDRDYRVFSGEPHS